MLTLLAVAGTASVAISQAAPAASATTPKIGTIAFNAAVSGTNEFQRDFAVVQKKFSPKEAELKSAADEVDTLKKQLQAQGDKLSDDEKATRVRTIDTKDKQLQRNVEDAQNEFQGESGQAFQKVAEKMFNFLQDYSKQNGYTMVVDRGNAQAPIVWYADPGNDITAAVVTAYNTKSGVPAQPTNATPPAPRPAATARPSTTTPKPAAKTPPQK